MTRLSVNGTRNCLFLLAAMLLAGLVLVQNGQAAAGSMAPVMSIETAEPAAATALSALAQPIASCASFNSRVWAQTVFDDDPARYAALDPDRDGLACETLATGVAPALWTDAIPADATAVALASVTDGDTIEVVLDGRIEAVRLVGVDARESGGPYVDVECYGAEGADFLQALLGHGGRLFLEQDQEDQDRFGRLLRWVWLDLDGEVYLINEAMVRAGYGERFRDTPNRRYADELIEAEEFAQRYDLGLWGACGGIASDTPPPFIPEEAPASGCDPAYPDVCIPPPPPDLACWEISETRFRMLPPDPHHFDGNGDGVGCEGPG
jgi:micrococcal nuclease